MDLIIDRGKLDEETCKLYALQMACSLNGLHSKGVCHRDIKGDNFLFQDKTHKVIKLIDFGLSKKFTGNSKLLTGVGTAYYVPPEILLNMQAGVASKEYGVKCDSWSFGVMLYIMITGQPPFLGENDAAIFTKILKGNFDMKKGVWSSVSAACKDLIKKLLVKDPSKRLSMSEVINHKWISPLEQNLLKESQENLTHNLIQRLMTFRAAGKFQKEIIKIMVDMESDFEQMELSRKAFFYLDYTNNGIISFRELKTFFNEIEEEGGFKGKLNVCEMGADCQVSKGLTDDEIREILDDLQLRDEGVVSYTEFIAATIGREFFFDENRIAQTFRIFDVAHTGKVTFDNINECFKRRGMNLSRKRIGEFLAEYDFGNECISLDEFTVMMKSEAPDKRLQQLKLTHSMNLKQGSTSFEHKKSLAQQSHEEIKRMESNVGNGEFVDDNEEEGFKSKGNLNQVDIPLDPVGEERD